MPVIDQEIGERYAAYHADCMEVLKELKAGSIGQSLYSPPFPELYQYSNDPRDMTNCVSYEESIEQYRYVVEQVARLTMPGRLSCVHCTDLKRGQYYQRDFPGDIIRVHEDLGMHFFCRITIWKDPWHFARRTRMVTLMHKTLTEDSSLCRVAPPDYVMVFRKPGESAPIAHPLGLTRYAGGEPIPKKLLEYLNYAGDQRKNLLSHWIWRRYASPVWMDIRRKRLLPYREAREKPEEKHVCPLQLDVIDRCLTLWSNPNDVVLTPFMGIGSEVCGALGNGRRAVGAELKATYYRQTLANIRATLNSSWMDQSDLPCGDTDDSEEGEINDKDEGELCHHTDAEPEKEAANLRTPKSPRHGKQSAARS